MTDEMKLYTHKLETQLHHLYDIADKARSLGLDSELKPESNIVKDLADMVEELVGPKGVAKRIRELMAQLNRYQLAFEIADDILLAKFGALDDQRAAEQAIKTSLAILTGGITAAPIQGISQIKIKENFDRTKYIAIYFAGPMRSAGGTEQALTLVLGDYIRKKLGLNRYKPNNEEVLRFIEELRVHEREVNRFQYHISDEALEKALRNLPIEVTGTETNPIEVSSFRNLPRIETNRVRGGALRVVNDGICGRAMKLLRIIKDLELEGWNWLDFINSNDNENEEHDEFNENDETENNDDQKNNETSDFMYMEDVIAGRPIFSFPSRAGGFRLRYGRSRNSGLSALGVHPATMSTLQNFIAVGTQLRIEKPGKGGVAMPVDSLEPPIVKLIDGSVVVLDSVEEVTKHSSNISEILFLGDLLVGFGEFLENNKALYPCGYVEEWWIQEVKSAIALKYQNSIVKASEDTGVLRLENFIKSPLEIKPTAYECISLSKTLNIPLHPKFTYFWEGISTDELAVLRGAFTHSNQIVEKGQLKAIELPMMLDVKAVLEWLCVQHKVDGDKIIIEEPAPILASCLNLNHPEIKIKRELSTIEALENISGLKIRSKGSTFIGARMGRPEKARERKMSPPVHFLFPVGLMGGSRRNLLETIKKGSIQVEISLRRCPECKVVTHKLLCDNCNTPTYRERICPNCKRVVEGEFCPVCKKRSIGYQKQTINVNDMFQKAVERLGIQSPPLVKGVRGLTNIDKTPEIIEKGILRARHDLYVFKDGTIRFDMTDAPLTHFKPSEIEVSIDKIKFLGYQHDIYGDQLVKTDQICELKVQDVIVSESCGDYLSRVAQFLDELLIRVYNLPPHYNVKTRQDLIGNLVIGLAPHTSAGVLGRIIGFTKAKVCYAHPLWHNVKRRDCDGDEDAVMLVLDVLLNFSRAYLPARIGGMMDAPLLIISAINPFEVDEALNVDIASKYPLTFYKNTMKKTDPAILKSVIDTVSNRLGTPAQFEGYSFTHPTTNINGQNWESAYLKLGAMTDKLKGQLTLAEKIRAVDAKEVAKRVLTTHFIRDIAGNLKAFTGQRFRCKKCNAKYRRIPVVGNCIRCGGELTQTVYRGGIEKYLDGAEELVQRYGLTDYYYQRIDLIKDEIELIFNTEGEQKVKQAKLGQFM